VVWKRRARTSAIDLAVEIAYAIASVIALSQWPDHLGLVSLTTNLLLTCRIHLSNSYRAEYFFLRYARNG